MSYEPTTAGGQHCSVCGQHFIYRHTCRAPWQSGHEPQESKLDAILAELRKIREALEKRGGT